jgi:KDO2-lipid IV(A) lauroyltransferase
LTRWYHHRFHSVGILRFVFFSMRVVPRFAQPPFAAVTALCFYLGLRRERAAVTRNLRRISGRGGLELHWKVYRVFYSLCDLIVSYSRVPAASDAQLLAMLAGPERGADTIDKCLAEGRGLIVWTAHLGNPEFASRLLELHGRPVNVARVVEDKPAERMLRDLMVNGRLRIVDLRAGASASIELLQALRRNEIVAMQGDRVYQPHHRSTVPFFGADAEFPRGPFLLARASGAPVLPGVVVRQGWLRYRVLIGDPIFPASAGDLRQEDLPELRQAVRFLETQVANYYDQWLNFFDFWRVDDIA